ncbi:MAG: alkaline phosphatase family protein [Gammaproteobacteria bacterium]|nr:alkaline phosphatase family protein [Gammaproteobacteria bacterium]
MTTTPSVVMIGLDAAEVTVIEELCAAGKLPALSSLIERGCFGRLESEAPIFSGGVWPTFYTSKRVPWHGIYHDRLWHYDKMRFETVGHQWLPEKPFWERLDEKYRIAVIDVPMVLGIPKSMNGVIVVGWGTHDRVFTGSWPPRLWGELRRQFGAPTLAGHTVRPRTVPELLQFKKSLQSTTEQVVRLSQSLLGREPWDVFLVVLGATHRGGHHLWDLSQIEHNSFATETTLGRGLEEVYVACDRAVGRIVANLSEGTKIMVFAVHGMGANPGWNDRCAEILRRIQQADAEPRRSRDRKRSVPSRAIDFVVWRLLPLKVRNQLRNRHYTREFDWSRTRCFPLKMDHAGYLRINVKGREPRGIVKPGQEYTDLCNEIREAFLGLRDLDTNEPIVNEIYQVDDLAPPGAPYRDLLPDLVVVWSGVSAIRSKGIYSKRSGEIRWNTDGRIPSLRSGNHRSSGWFVAAGDGIEPGTRADGYHIIDLVPTVYQWIGAEQAHDFQGNPISALV